MARIRHHQMLLCCVAACALANSGCMRRMGLSHSSLTPRTASLDQESTFRSQSLTSTNTVKPRARLLAPKFGHSAGSITSSIDGKDNGPALGFTAEDFRQFMNERSRNPMSEGQVLIDQPERWSVLDRPAQPPKQSASLFQPDVQAKPTAPLTIAVPDSTPATAATEEAGSLSPEDFEEPPPEKNFTQTATFQDETPPVSEVSAEDDPSVFDRLRGLYDSDSENSASGLIKQQIQKLPSPWSVFRDRSEPRPSEETTANDADQEAEALIAQTNDQADKLQQLIEEHLSEIESWPRTPSGLPTAPEQYQRLQQNLRLLYLVANQPGDAISTIDSVAADQQEFWQELMLALAQYRDLTSEVDDEARYTGTLNQLRSATQRLRPLSALSIRRLEICTRIHSFGRIEPFPSNDFDPGDPILLYVEVDNFGTKLTPDGKYRTSVIAQLQIYQDGNPEPIETLDVAGGISDEASSERRDYFQSYELNLPSHLATGRYEIRVLLADKITGKRASARTGFQIR